MSARRILIVANEQIVAEDLRRTLTGGGYEIAGIARSGEEAVSEGRKTRPDLVIMDMVVRGSRDGLSAAQELLALGIPVLYLTASWDRHLIERGQHTQPAGYILKPANDAEVRAAVQLALHQGDQEHARESESVERFGSSREADAQFRLLVAGVTEYAIFTLDAHGNVNSWNAGAERINGYAAGEILGTPHAVLFPPEDRAANVPEAELERARERGSADNSRWLVRRDGTRYWAEGILAAVRNDGGTLAGYTKVIRDGTARKRLQEELANQEERLQVALHAARTGTWHWDLQTNADAVDESLRTLFGLNSEKDIQTIDDFFALVHAEDRPRVQAAFGETRTSGVHLDTEFRLVRPDGTERWFIDQGDVISRDGKPAYMTGACVDITERKEAERSLRLSEQRFRLFVDNVKDYALFQMDVQGRIETWNSGAEDLLRYSTEEIIGQPSAILFVPEDVAAGEPEREIRGAAASGRAQDERWHIRKDGTRFWCSGVLTAIRDDQGKLLGFAKVMHDETERRLANERIQASLAEKEVLLKEIHHRVKNNLQVITSLLRLQSDAAESETIQQMLDEACNRVRAIGEIHELLYRSPDLARIDFGVYLKRLGHNLQEFYGRNPDKVALGVSSDLNVPVSEAIPCGLIVNELLTNAFKHAFPGGRSGTVEVSLKEQADHYILEVADDGVGMAVEPNWQNSNSLGLRLVAVLARQLRGAIHAHTAHGTRVRVTFPRPAGGLP